MNIKEIFTILYTIKILLRYLETNISYFYISNYIKIKIFVRNISYRSEQLIKIEV